MKETLLLLAVLGIVFTVHSPTSAQSVDWKWAKTAIGKGDDRGNKITTDRDGNTIVTGRFLSKEIVFDSIRLVNSDQDSSTSDVFMAKYGPDGRVLWARSFGGYGDDLGLHCATDLDGNIILIVGYDCERITVGKQVFTNRTDKGKGSDVLIVKCSSTGTIIWAKSVGGSRHDGGYATCAADREGSIYVTGAFFSPFFQIDSMVLTNSKSRGSDTFFAKFSSAGKLLWARSSGVALDSETQSCAIDPHGNLILSGWFTGQMIAFDSDTLRNPGKESANIFVTKYSTAGKLIWAKRFGGPSTGMCAVDGRGNIILTGIFGDSVLTFGKTNLLNEGDGDIYVTKLDDDGSVLWARSAGGNSADGARNVCVDKNNNIIITGSFRSPVLTFGKTILRKDTTLIKPNERTEDMFIAGYSPDGKVLWAKGAGGNGRNTGRSCAADKNGNIYLTGSFETPLFQLGVLKLANSGSTDVFVAKLSSVK